MAAQVQVQVTGGPIKLVKNVDTVQELREKLELGKDYTATVKGEPADDDQDLEEFDFVGFAQAVRGGSR